MKGATIIRATFGQFNSNAEIPSNFMAMSRYFKFNGNDKTLCNLKAMSI